MSKQSNAKDANEVTEKDSQNLDSKAKSEKEVGGYEDQGLLEPTRYNDWEVKGRCSDF